MNTDCDGQPRAMSESAPTDTMPDPTRRRARTRPRCRAIAAALLAMALLGACSTSGSDTIGSSATTTTEAPASADQDETAAEPADTAVEPIDEPEPEPEPEPEAEIERPILPIEEHDLLNREYDLICPTGEMTLGLVDGEWVDEDGPTIGFAGEVEITHVDVTGDGVDEAIVNMVCSTGASTVTRNAFVMQATADGPVQLGNGLMAWTEFVDGQLVNDEFVHAEGDPRCCPSGKIRSILELEDDRWVVTSVFPLTGASA